MASVNAENTTAIVKYDHHSLLRPSNLQLTPGKVEQLTLQEQYGPNQSIKMAFPVLRINASHPVTVTAIVEGPMSAASYLVYPENVAGEVYRMMPFCNKTIDGLCICVIITLKENTTIMLENENNGNISVYTQKHAVGEETIDYLSMPHSKINFMNRKKHSYISLESHDDFTGLLLQANCPVVVFCGGRKQDATMSMEQILPIEYFGQNYYAFPFDHNAVATPKLRFIAHYNCTTISLDHQDSWKRHAGETLELSINKSAPFKFFANKPVALIQIFSGPSPSRKDQNNYEEGLLLLPAMEQYVSAVVIPRRKKKDKSATSRMKMLVGLVSDVSYNFQTQIGNTSRKTISRDIVWESDDDGRLLKLAQNGCSNGNTFGAYTYRRAGNDASFSIVGFKFFKRKNENRRYFGETCINTQEEENVPIDTKNTMPTTDTPSSTEIRQTNTEKYIIEDNNKETSTRGSAEISSNKIRRGTAISIEPNVFQNTCPPCQSKPKTDATIQTEEEIEEKIKEIKKTLTINKHDLSSYRRKKISADDTRSSAKGIGLLGACILCAFVSFIFIMDFKTLAHQGSALWRKLFGPNPCFVRERLRMRRGRP
ncbi:uncharacterized protein LOC133178914 [Saccostrea echinata]|uniref:uncharacterized protein LOC133178914 n=1 Tax=Saccostrea echinata TaxID=191078 RepID=UPI002A833848|nr:uncharacterized protein LOC133178914 [Saccostrea echinata]